MTKPKTFTVLARDVWGDKPSKNIEATLVLVDTKIEKTRKLGKEVVIKLPIYNVIVDGAVIGQVRRYMATMERSAPGARYVTARWSSPRWTCSSAKTRVPTIAYDTQKRALDELVNAFYRDSLREED